MRRFLLALCALLFAVSARAQGVTYIPDPTGAGLPPLQKTTVVVPQASVATLFSVPYTLVPAITGKVLVPEWVYIVKPAGTGWTTTGSGTLRVGWSGGVGAHEFTQYDQSTTTGFFGASADTWIAPAGPATQSGGVGVTATFHAASGKSIVLRLATADISGGTGDLTVTIWYRSWGLTSP